VKIFAIAVVFLSIAWGCCSLNRKAGALRWKGPFGLERKMIAAAGVTIRETQTGLERNLTTGAEGEYRAVALPVGVYTIEATASGFATSRAENIALTVGETKRANFTLQVASVSSAVTVVGDTQVVNL